MSVEKNIFQKEIPPLSQKWIIILSVGVLIVAGLTIAIVAYQSSVKAKDQKTSDLIAEQQQELNNLKVKLEKDKTDLQTSINNTQNSVADIVTEWKDRVVKVNCEWDNADGTVNETDSASGLLRLFSDGLNVITNSHVILDDTGSVADRCVVGLYGIGARSVKYQEGDLEPFFTLHGGQDGAYILIDSKFLEAEDEDSYSDNGTFDTIASVRVNPCVDNSVVVGDKVVVLGYPAIGTKRGITATEGIISGLEGDYYVTSAKIDHGNSGGAAILIKNDCYLGVPTWVENKGGFESLGRILKSSFFFE